MIVYACGAVHESHSFNKFPTPLSAFQDTEVGCIDADPGRIDTKLIEAGALVAARDCGWDMHFPFFATATPSGPLSAECFDTIRSRLLEELSKLEHVDGVLLPMHGAMFALNEPDCEGAVVEAVREMVGPDVPIALSLDPHANVTDRMVRNVDIITSYRTTPHIDQCETTLRAGMLLDAAMNGKTRPHAYVARLPMMSGLDMGRTLDPNGPMQQLQNMAREIEAEDAGVLNIDINAGFYYGDVYETGPSVVVTGDGEDARYQEIADRLIREAWKTKEYFSVDFLSAEEATALAAADTGTGGPLILADFTDGTFGGAHGDGTVLMDHLLRADIRDTVVGPMFDPEAVKLVQAAGEGATLTLEIGGKTDPEYGGTPVSVEVEVLKLSDGFYTRRGPFSTGSVGEFGDSASVRHGNVTIILVSKRIQPEDREQYRIFGINPEETNIIAMKGINHFRADFEPTARKLVFVDTGGLVAVDFTMFPFENVRRPVWPLDDVELPSLAAE